MMASYGSENFITAVKPVTIAVHNYKHCAEIYRHGRDGILRQGNERFAVTYSFYEKTVLPLKHRISHYAFTLQHLAN